MILERSTRKRTVLPSRVASIRRDRVFPRRTVLLWAAGAGLFALPGFAPRGAQPAAASHSVHFRDRFDSGGLNALELPYPEDWIILSEGGRHYLHMKGSRPPGVPRRPLQFALLKTPAVGSFTFRARVRREGRSMIVVFNYVDTLHFYYTHLSMDAGRRQPVHNGIFLVNNADRARIAGLEATPALPDRRWHSIRVVRDAPAGRIEVYSDVETRPLFSVIDHAFTCGRIGIGSFDETGDFTDVELDSNDPCAL